MSAMGRKRTFCRVTDAQSSGAGSTFALPALWVRKNRENTMPGQLPPTSDDRVIWDLWESMFRLPVATAADEAGIFRALGDTPLTTEELAKGLGLEVHPLAIVLG